jgi:hypothetical protein
MSREQTIIDIQLSKDRLYEAIREGVGDAIFRIATNNTDMPCADFYEAIKQGVAEALKNKDLT